jgi:hypothetical protein
MNALTDEDRDLLTRALPHLVLPIVIERVSSVLMTGKYLQKRGIPWIEDQSTLDSYVDPLLWCLDIFLEHVREDLRQHLKKYETADP